MHLPTSEIITDLLLDVIDLEASEDKLKEIIDNDPYARSIIEEERETIEIEAYLSGELKKKAKERFEQKLSTNSQLQGELKLHKEINGYLILENFRLQLDEIHRKLNFSVNKETDIIDFKQNTEKEERSFTKWMVAASILFLAVFSFTMFNHGFRGITVERQLYAQYYKPFNADDVSKTIVVNSNTLDDARKKYNQGKYHEAILGFNNLPDNLQVQTEKNFYLGLSLMEINSYKQAIDKFKLVIENENNEWLPQAYWYMGLCYLKIGNKTEAEEVFSFIVDNQIQNSNIAEKILDKLK